MSKGDYIRHIIYEIPGAQAREREKRKAIAKEKIFVLFSAGKKPKDISADDLSQILNVRPDSTRSAMKSVFVMGKNEALNFFYSKWLEMQKFTS